jgi:WD40 repeat protein/serine/threonine protein kinase
MCLLKAGLSDTVLTEHPAAPPSESAPATLPDFGPYRTIGVLGEGGMGIVYLAEQQEPVRRRVALKVLKSGEAGSQVLARFESESQALALMDHPNIAHIYEAGTTAGGRPYFAMEYVPGVPITDYCDRNLLGFRERLTLFQQVCQAVHHAHQKGVIHRDLKPSNILVMLQDGVPLPKVIDFGVAKAVNHRLTEKTLFTEFGMLVGTPEYMSPEQADLTGPDIDSTTDVYSLGVVLYELLVGALPFDSKSLRKAGFAEIQRVIRETEPPKPSTRLSTMGEAAQEAARHRRSDVRTMARLLRGDLEWITMKALEKDRTRRYDSASEFGADIGRHLANEPVMAGAPDLSYRVLKLVRRHRGLVAAGSAVFLALVAGGVISFALYVREAREHERAESESYEANLSAADIQLRAGHVYDARERLARAAPGLRGWEWRYLMARTDESSATLYSRAPVAGMGLSKDGSAIFCYSRYFLRFWELSTKRVIADLPPFGRFLTFSRYGETVLAMTEYERGFEPPEGAVLRLYDVKTRKILAQLRGLSAIPLVSVISDDGTLVAAAPERTYQRVKPLASSPKLDILIWDARNGNLLMRVETQRDVNSLKFSANGKTLAIAYGDVIQLWDIIGRRLTATLTPAGGSFLCFTRDGGLLVSETSDGKMEVWDANTGKLLRSWQVGTEVTSAALSPDDTILATSSRAALQLWEMNSGQLRDSFNGGQDALHIAFHPTAPKVYTSSSGVTKEWDLRRLTAVEQTAQPIRVAFSPDGKYFASGSRDGRVRIFDATSGNLLRDWAASANPISDIAISPDSLLVASSSVPYASMAGATPVAGGDNSINVWSASAGALLRTLTGHTLDVWSIAFSPDGSRIASGSEDQTIRIWELNSAAPPTIVSTSSPITQVAFSPDGHTLLGLRRLDKSILLWNTTTQQNSGMLAANTYDYPRWFRPMALDRDGKVVIGPADGGQSVAIWDLRARRRRQILPVFRAGAVGSLAITPDGSRAVMGDLYSGSISIWDLRRGNRLLTLGAHAYGDIVGWYAWSPDGTRLLSCGTDRTIRVWDSRSAYNIDAELLLDGLFEKKLLAEEVVENLRADTSIPPALRAEAMQLARQRGNAPVDDLMVAAWSAGNDPNLSAREYSRALRRAMVAAQSSTWLGRSQVVIGLLQYRTGDFAGALLSTRPTMEISKSVAPQSHEIRAMAQYRLHDLTTAQREVALARKLVNDANVMEDHKLLDEAEALIGPDKSGAARHN